MMSWLTVVGGVRETDALILKILVNIKKNEMNVYPPIKTLKMSHIQNLFCKMKLETDICHS